MVYVLLFFFFSSVVMDEIGVGGWVDLLVIQCLNMYILRILLLIVLFLLGTLYEEEYLTQIHPTN